MQKTDVSYETFLVLKLFESNLFTCVGLLFKYHSQKKQTNKTTCLEPGTNSFKVNML